VYVVRSRYGGGSSRMAVTVVKVGRTPLSNFGKVIEALFGVSANVFTCEEGMVTGQSRM